MASHLVPHNGVRQDVEFFGTGRHRMFGSTHYPPDPPVGGLVICSPLLGELITNYRREFLLAGALAASGIAVQRFHYRGTGHSDGDSSMVTFDTMRADALAAAEYLAHRTELSAIAFAGTRMAGLIAAAAGSRLGDGPLVLWEPAIDASRYFRDVLRAHLMSKLKDGKDTRSSAISFVKELRRTGWFEVMGYPVDRSLYDSSLGHKLDEELGVRPRSILLAQIAGTHRLKDQYAGLATGWRERDFKVTTHAIVEKEAWWFTGERWRAEENRDGTRRLIEITSGWLAEEFVRLGAPI
jgi:hypothetical protein